MSANPHPIIAAAMGTSLLMLCRACKGNERQESNPQRWRLLVGDALSPVGVRYDVRCNPSGPMPHLYKPPNLYNVSDAYCWRNVIGSRIKGGTLYRCAIGFILAVRSVLPAENHIRDQYKPATAIGTM